MGQRFADIVTEVTRQPVMNAKVLSMMMEDFRLVQAAEKTFAGNVNINTMEIFTALTATKRQRKRKNMYSLFHMKQ